MVHNLTEAKMDMTFYEDFPPFPQHQRMHNGDMNVLKRTLTLDLNKANNGNRKPKLLTPAPILSSPDLKMLKLSDPEVEKFILSQQASTGNILITPTPTTTAILFPKLVTEEQEMYVQGFEEALSALHNSDSNQSTIIHQSVELPRSSSNSSSSSSSNLCMALEPNYPPVSSSAHNIHPNFSNIIIKDEPQTVPSLEAPIDMETQERIKLERKRQRNRLAASKCRKRKLERIAKLEDKVKVLKSENSDLSAVVKKLKERICELKERVMDHVHNGCQIMQTFG